MRTNIKDDQHYKELLQEFKETLEKGLTTTWGAGRVTDVTNKTAKDRWGHTAVVYEVNNCKGLVEHHLVWYSPFDDNKYADWRFLG
jgi:hypothetical protein